MKTDGETEISGDAGDQGAQEAQEAAEDQEEVVVQDGTQPPAEAGAGEEPVGVESEEDILELIKQDNSWEQILYQVVAFESMDPWNLDLNILAKGFAEYVAGISELDFRIPAKWVIIASILLRMKSDHIKILKMDEDAEDEFMDLEELEELADMDQPDEEMIDMDPIEATGKRKPVRQVTISELVDSLKKVMRAEKRRDTKLKKRRGKIDISNDDITRRIDGLYKKIGDMLTTIKESEVKFSKLVGSWDRGKVVETFLPLVQLDQEKKVTCRQEKVFEEIFIKKRREREKAKAS
jgi:segregation and condensation protein A